MQISSENFLISLEMLRLLRDGWILGKAALRGTRRDHDMHRRGIGWDPSLELVPNLGYAH